MRFRFFLVIVATLVSLSGVAFATSSDINGTFHDFPIVKVNAVSPLSLLSPESTSSGRPWYRSAPSPRPWAGQSAGTARRDRRLSRLLKEARLRLSAAAP
jgi:hypothetical protein